MSDTSNDCIFCKIVAGEFGTEFVAESDLMVAFNDLSPQAPTHVLIVPRRHLASMADLNEGDAALLVDSIKIATLIARKRGLDASGYRLLTNVGPDAGQTIFHLHWHLLGGKPLGPLA